MIKNTLPLHPGTVLSEIYMSQMNLNQTELAKLCGCSPRKVNEIGIRGTVYTILTSVIPEIGKLSLAMLCIRLVRCNFSGKCGRLRVQER